MRAGLERPRWPGRLERLSWRGADILLDAAHNPEGAQALAAYLAETGWTRVALVIGVMADKDVDGIVAALVPHASRVICTRPPSPRALSADALASLVRGLVHDAVPVEPIAEPLEALERAANDGRIVVAGSIFLLGALRGILR
jgi:dihydrofolate synthase/folylpolyglutamate synthase